jgi:hypothetical protein
MEITLMWIVCLAGVAAILALFNGLALLVWVNRRGEPEKQRLDHEEQMRALELGQVLEYAELRKVKSAGAQAGAGAVVAMVVTAIMTISAALITAEIIHPPEYTHSLPILIVIWSLAAAVSLTAVALGAVAILGRRPLRKESEARRRPFEDKPPASSGSDSASQEQMQSRS